MLEASLADLVGLRGLLLVTEFSLRLGVGWGSTCAGVKVCRKLLDPSLWAGGCQGLLLPDSPKLTHVGVILELASLGQAGGPSWLAV